MISRSAMPKQLEGKAKGGKKPAKEMPMPFKKGGKVKKGC